MLIPLWQTLWWKGLSLPMACIIPIGLLRLVPSSILLALSSMCFYPNFFNLSLSLECKRHAQHKHDPCCSMEQSLALKVCFLCVCVRYVSCCASLLMVF